MPELILSCGLEGGGFDLYALTENDVTLFYVSGISMYLDDNDDEEWRSWESEKVAGWENALQLLQQHQWWITFPTYIHPDYRANVLAAILAQKEMRSDYVRARWLEQCQGNETQ